MIQLLKIRGNSIEPYLQDGDFAIIRKRHKRMTFRVGEYIVFHQKMYGVLIKRIHHINAQSKTLTVHGSHEFSSDSRLFGDIDPDQVIGKVLFRIRA
jgi:signal peptidase I